MNGNCVGCQLYTLYLSQKLIPQTVQANQNELYGIMSCLTD